MLFIKMTSAGLEPAFSAPTTLGGLEDRCGYEANCGRLNPLPQVQALLKTTDCRQK